GRPALVFLIAEDGTIEPRAITIGLSDWDRSQVLSGLEGGEQIALIGAAQLQQSQQDFLERIRSRSSSPFSGRGRGR
ncbi:MAG: efflux RND transporter periplasmic adaptor subunit, partial [Longimicrobiales bacterium]